MEGGDDILYYRELTYIYLPDLGGVLHHHELTYPVLPFISMLWPMDEEQ
jgi:hypothetical protein